MIKGTFKTQYRKQGGKLVFVYAINGTEAELADYKAVKGAFHRVDEKTKEVLFFGQRFAGNNIEIIKTKDGKDFAIDSTRVDQLASLTAQYGYEIAKDMMKEPVTE